MLDVAERHPEGLTLEAIAAQLSDPPVTRERIRQIEAAALDKIGRVSLLGLDAGP